MNCLKYIGILLVLVTGLGRAWAQPTSDPVAAVLRSDTKRPKLVVVISIDQFRADYLGRLGDLFKPARKDNALGGFQYLMHEGAYFANAQYEHYPLFTGPGHATIMSGGHPYKTGIIGNDWWDPATRKRVYSVDDPRYKVVGAAPASKVGPMGPLNMRSSTVGDELKMATACAGAPEGRAKVVALALKDRPAILMGGHAQDVCIWFDTEGGRWISSTAFCKDGKLRDWVTKINEERPFTKMLGETWSPKIEAAVLARRSIAPSVTSKNLPKGFGTGFPHKVGSEDVKENYRAFTLMPAANDYVLKTARQAVEQEKLGQRDVTDILAINLSTNDYVGHAFGPYSPEAVDLTVRTDEVLSEFINWLDGAVGMKNIIFVVTADHGVSPIADDAEAAPLNLSAGRYSVAKVVSGISAGLTRRFGAPAGGTWFSVSADPAEAGSDDLKKNGTFIEGLVYLNPEAIEGAIAGGKARTRRDVEQAACDAVNGARIPGVYGCYGKTQILEGQIADHELAHHLALGVHPQISGDLIVVQEQFFLQDPNPEGHATTHGTPYTYDIHVPILMCAPGLVRAGVYLQRVAPSDIAPTLSMLLGIELPSGCDGNPLLPALLP